MPTPGEVLLILYLLLSKCISVEVEFLHSSGRFGNQVTFDYYYACMTCGISLEWFRNGQSAGGYMRDINNPGDVALSNGYLSIYLSSTTGEQGIACITSILQVHQLETPNVSCRGQSGMKVANNSRMGVGLTNSTNGTVMMEFVFSSDIFPSLSYRTHIFLCDVTNSSYLLVNINAIPVGRFDAISTSGDHQNYNMDTLANDTLATTAILLDKQQSSGGQQSSSQDQGNSFTAIIAVLVGRSFSESITVSCQSDSHKVMLDVLDQSGSQAPIETGSPGTESSTFVSAETTTNSTRGSTALHTIPGPNFPFITVLSICVALGCFIVLLVVIFIFLVKRHMRQKKRRKSTSSQQNDTVLATPEEKAEEGDVTGITVLDESDNGADSYVSAPSSIHGDKTDSYVSAPGSFLGEEADSDGPALHHTQSSIPATYDSSTAGLRERIRRGIKLYLNS